MSDLPACVNLALHRAYCRAYSPDSRDWGTLPECLREELAALFRVPENPRAGDTWLAVVTHRMPFEVTTQYRAEEKHPDAPPPWVIPRYPRDVTSPGPDQQPGVAALERGLMD